MHPFARAAATLHLAALGLWAGITAMTGAAAAVAFPTIKEIRPVLANTKDPDTHWLLVAGKAVNSIFEISNYAQGLFAAVAAATAVLLLLTQAAPRRTCRHIWLAATGLALALLAYYMFVVWPRMEHNLSEFWDMTMMDKEGTKELADTARQAFRADHPLASRLLVGILLSSLVALFSGAWTLLSRKEHP